MSETLPEMTPYRVEMLVDRADELTAEAVSTFEREITGSGIGSLRIKAVRDIQPSDIEHLPDGAKRALNFHGSVVVDAGEGIGALIDAVPQAEQSFSTSEVNRALLDSGLIKDGRVMKMGASGAVVDEQRGAEVIEIKIFDTRDKVTKVMSKAKAAWSDGEGKLHVTALDDDRRVLLENEFLVEEGNMRDSNAVALQIDVKRGDIDLYQLLANVARKAGLEDYTVRCTIEGPIKAKIAVIKGLPDQRINDIKGVKEVLMPYDVETDGTFHFVGSRSAQASRQNKRWGDITGNPVYSPNGHYHGYSLDGKVGGHILEIKPKNGSRVMMIIEPARVARVVEKESLAA